MSEETAYAGLVIGWFVLAAATALALTVVSAPYGRHAREGWGPRLHFVTGWTLMELPAALGMALWFALGDRHGSVPAIVFLVMWEVHYVNRAVVDPLLRRGRARPMPLGVVALGACFNIGNTYLNGRWLFTLGPDRSVDWLSDPRFIGGVVLFGVGWAINLHSDALLRRLRRPGESGYRIPRGGLYEWVTSPNYLGEIIEWLGWALATWSLAGLAFAVWTAANLAPRAHAHHLWYKRRFPDYPPERRRLVPFLF